MILGLNGDILIKHYESKHDGDLSIIGLQPKMCPAGIWTEGWGHAMVYKGKFLKGIENKELAYQLARISDPNIDDDVEAQMLFIEDVGIVEAVLKRRLRIDLNQNQYDALLSHTFNCGVSDTLYRLINTGNFDSPELAEWWQTKFITVNKIKLPGLALRRRCEFRLFRIGKLEFNV